MPALWLHRWYILVMVGALAVKCTARAGDIEAEPINYSTATAANAVSAFCKSSMRS